MRIDVLKFFRQKIVGPIACQGTTVQILMNADCISAGSEAQFLPCPMAHSSEAPDCEKMLWVYLIYLTQKVGIMVIIGYSTTCGRKAQIIHPWNRFCKIRQPVVFSSSDRVLCCLGFTYFL